MNNQPHGPPVFDRDREAIEEQRRVLALHQQEDLAQRAREHTERQERDRREREQYQATPAHQNDAGSIPIHQPVASRLPGAIHSPGGLLANHGGAPSSGPLGAPSGPGNAFGGPLHNEASRPIPLNPQNATSLLQQQQGFGPNILHHNSASSIGAPGGPAVNFGGPLQQQQPPQDAVRLQQLSFGAPLPQGHPMAGPPALGQGGQQPILNDALSYLDQVKVQFADQPDVYNRFLDIMKDFKSQAIDTPGVINRVSELFAGHPNLIQGFNTFLPPGYRIECGTGNDPNSIRVTTPMGTTVQSIHGRALPGSATGSVGATSSGYYGQPRPSNWQQEPQHSIESPEGVFSPQNQNSGQAYNPNSGHSTYEAQQAAAAAAHQQQQRGVSQLTNAVATLGHPPRNAQTPTPGAQASINGGPPQPGLEKRGPVEFNHAISYVNKIKNRFQDRPEIYKQFLEILQTYQRESKPIQDVYAQVTYLFNTAPDLLEDFKQFLPESAAQAKAAAAAKAAEEAALGNQTPQNTHSGRGEGKLPPVGNFSVAASASKENKKRQRNNAAGPSGSQVNIVGEGPRGIAPSVVNKRNKLSHPNKIVSDAPVISPTLTPIVPEPLPPTSTSGATSEELAFFDRVKKYIGNKQTMNEFLKLCNLFSQDLIDRNVLVYRVSSFIGGNLDLMNWFKAFVSFEGNDEIMENRPQLPTGRPALSNCRGLGPSYRLLPRRERNKPCSGRDALCDSVLNDEWASHPTWASEDSGFVAHRKNTYEESLHRIEEERHDYDFNIETNAKCIQLIEPIAQSLLAMTQAEREAFRLPLGLGTPSRAVYNRVFKKIYGAEGPRVVQEMFEDPCAVLPVVLPRLKQKDEEWRLSQREWQKIWQSQTNQNYLRSLDHQGIHVKGVDKKTFTAKAILDSIKSKHEEQRRQQRGHSKVQRHQYAYHFDDQDVITDVLRIMVLYISNANQHNPTERRRITEFFEKIVAHFFGISMEIIAECSRDVERANLEDEDEDPTPDLPNGARRRPINGRKNNVDLRRDVLNKKTGGRGRGQKEESASGSKESTPDVESVIDDDTLEAIEDQAVSEVTNERWATAPSAIALAGTQIVKTQDLEIKTDQSHKRDSYKLYGNGNIYVFFHIFASLYQRLKLIKESEQEAREDEQRANRSKPAKELGLIPDQDEFFRPILSRYKETYYSRTLRLIDDFIAGDLEEPKYQEFLRHYFLRNGWRLYSITDLLKTLCRVSVACSGEDNKDKTTALLDQFYKNRQNEETSYSIEINMRKQADKYIKDGELFLIEWHTKTAEARIQWIQREDTTFDLQGMELMEQWQYYTSSYIRIEPTEGVDRTKMKRSVLKRNLPKPVEVEAEESGLPKPLVYFEELNLRICINSSRIVYGPGSEYFVYADKPMTTNEEGVNAATERLRKQKENRADRFKEKFEMNSAWMKDLNHEQVSQATQDFNRWIGRGDDTSLVPAATASSSVDVTMTSA